MVGIWPGKKIRAESEEEIETSQEMQGQPRERVRVPGTASTYPALPVPRGPKGSNRAPGGTAPGGSWPGMPDDGSMPGCGRPDRRGSTIIPPLRPLPRGKAEEMRLVPVRAERSVALWQTSAAGPPSTGTQRLLLRGEENTPKPPQHGPAYASEPVAEARSPSRVCMYTWRSAGTHSLSRGVHPGCHRGNPKASDPAPAWGYPQHQPDTGQRSTSFPPPPTPVSQEPLGHR